MTKEKSIPRPHIPVQTERELWARSAGRCDFRSCSRLLYRDELTQTKSNLAKISHIVAFRPDGPRGHPTRSKELEIDINNLMLTCADHGKIIDDKAREADYPEALLLEYKQEHEHRVRMLTEVTGDAQTHLLFLQVPIDVRHVTIDQKSAFRAILPKYSAEEVPTRIDLNGMRIPTDTPEFFQLAGLCITKETEAFLARNHGNHKVNSISVFALAPIPLLIHLGHLLGDSNHVDLYQRHRSVQDWTWQQEEEIEEFYHVIKPKPLDGDQPIALLLSISDRVSRGEVVAAMGEEPLMYEISARDPGLDFLRSRKRLEVFGLEVRRLLRDLRDSHPHTDTIHLFAAVPSPVAIQFGRDVRGLDSPFLVYEYQKRRRSYLPALTINTH